MKIILFVVLFVFSGCNIEFGWAGDTPGPTKSPEKNSTIKQENNTTIPVPDKNVSNDSNLTVIKDNNENIEVSTESIFDKNDAILDVEACGSFDGYLTVKDNSFDPEGFYDSKNGITIGSSYPLNFSPKNTEVVLFYTNLTVNKSNTFKTIYESNYYISFDKSWVNNTTRTIYIKTPKLEITDNKYGCYRYELNSVSSKIKKTKVYRLN